MFPENRARWTQPSPPFYGHCCLCHIHSLNPDTSLQPQAPSFSAEMMPVAIPVDHFLCPSLSLSFCCLMLTTLQWLPSVLRIKALLISMAFKALPDLALLENPREERIRTLWRGGGNGGIICLQLKKYEREHCFRIHFQGFCLHMGCVPKNPHVSGPWMG